MNQASGDSSPDDDLDDDPRDEPCTWCDLPDDLCQCADAIFGAGNTGQSCDD